MADIHEHDADSGWFVSYLARREESGHPRCRPPFAARYGCSVNGRLDVRRRQLLGALVSTPVAAVVLGSCTGDPPGKRPRPAHRTDADIRVRWRAAVAEQDLLLLHAAAVAKHSALDEVIAPFTAHHRAHLQALLDEGPLPLLARLDAEQTPGKDSGGSGGNGAGDSSSNQRDDDTSTNRGREVPGIPDDAEDALEVIREAERTAAESHITECLQASSRRLAALLGSMAAAEAAHDAALEDA